MDDYVVLLIIRKSGAVIDCDTIYSLSYFINEEGTKTIRYHVPIDRVYTIESSLYIEKVTGKAGKKNNILLREYHSNDDAADMEYLIKHVTSDVVALILADPDNEEDMARLRSTVLQDKEIMHGW